MKRLLDLIILSLLVVFFSCKKENIDEVIIEEFVFQADTSVEKSGFIKIKIDGATLLEEAGFAFLCNASHRKETRYMISNDFMGRSFIYILNSEVDKTDCN